MSFVENDIPEDDSTSEVGEVEEIEELSDYGRRFVENAPEEERVYAEKYVREWDKGYKKATSKYEEELNTYRQIGAPVEDLHNGYRLLQTMVNNPQRVLEYLTSDPNGPQLTVAQAKAAMEDAKEEVDPHVEKINKIERAVLSLAQEREAERQRQAVEAQKAEFAAGLKAAADKYGAFDEKIVVGIIAGGHAQSIDEAVQHYHKVVGKPQQRRATPPLLGASSAAPSGAKKLDIAGASTKERVNYLTHILSGE